MAQVILKKRFGWLRKILRNGREYLDRYSLREPLPYEHEEPSKGCCIYLHHLLAEDLGHLHNHPWKWSFSIPLWGSYVQAVSKRSTQGHLFVPAPERLVRWFNWLTPERYHSITKLHPGPGARGVWTLFVAGPTAKEPWGFWVPERGAVSAKQLRAEEKARGEG